LPGRAIGGVLREKAVVMMGGSFFLGRFGLSLFVFLDPKAMKQHAESKGKS